MDILLILQKIRAGDRAAFTPLVEHYQGPLFGFLGRMGLSPQQAQDIAQESFLRAWTQLGRYDPRAGQFSTWLFTIARNLALNEAERASSRQENPVGDELPDATCPRPGPAEQLSQAQEKRRLQAALKQLPTADRSVLALAYVSELDLDAIARIEGASVGAIKTRLSRARQKLRHIWQNESPREENHHD